MTRESLFFTLVGIAGFALVMGMGGLIAWACGFDLNEPEYYEQEADND